MSDIAQPIHQVLTPGLLGASDAAGALGLDRYKPPILVAKRLRGEAVEEAESEPAEWGKALEPIVRAKYALRTRSHVAVPLRSDTHPVLPWLRATPDGYAYPTGDEEPTVYEAVSPEMHTRSAAAHRDGQLGLVQVKTCAAWLADDWAEWIPQKYEVQVRVEMAVTDMPWCDVVCLVGGQRFVGPFRVKRDLKLEDRILTDLEAFHRRVVVLGLDPDPDATEAYRAHVSSLMRPTKVVMPTDADLTAHIDDWRTVRYEKKQLEKREDELKNYLLLRMSAAGATGIDAGELGKVSAYKTGDRMDWAGYAKFLEMQTGNTGLRSEIAIREGRNLFKKPSTTWALRAPSDWNKDAGSASEEE